jgi:hypothetical protein
MMGWDVDKPGAERDRAEYKNCRGMYLGEHAGDSVRLTA